MSRCRVPPWPLAAMMVPAWPRPRVRSSARMEPVARAPVRRASRAESSLAANWTSGVAGRDWAMTARSLSGSSQAARRVTAAIPSGSMCTSVNPIWARKAVSVVEKHS